MLRIFISYSRKDEVFARQIAGELSQFDIDVWMDIEDIPVGQKWSNAIQQGLDTSDLMLVILSPTSMESTNVEDEFTYFLDQKKPVIPLLFQPTRIHFQLGRVQYIDFHGQTFEPAMKQLFGEIERRRGNGPASMAHTTSAPPQVPVQTPLPVKEPTRRQPRVDLSQGAMPSGAAPFNQGRSTQTQSSPDSSNMMRLALFGGLALVVLVIAFLVLRSITGVQDSITDPLVINAPYFQSDNGTIRIKQPQGWTARSFSGDGVLVANESWMKENGFENLLIESIPPGKIGVKASWVKLGGTKLASGDLHLHGLDVINGILASAGNYSINASDVKDRTYNGYEAVYAQGNLADSDYYITLIYMPDKDAITVAVANTSPGELEANDKLVQDLIRSVQVS
ncbi:MAG TPA: toll/interleukin-1 receptor domain-containing protein [Phototrophicaceae bacterium]|jgi:hypothetical protein|nr:toll/interleukin-1 receptor domain-containing protein [Phototrophicaceae bacterium]